MWRIGAGPTGKYITSWPYGHVWTQTRTDRRSHRTRSTYALGSSVSAVGCASRSGRGPAGGCAVAVGVPGDDGRAAPAGAGVRTGVSLRRPVVPVGVDDLFAGDAGDGDGVVDSRPFVGGQPGPDAVAAGALTPRRGRRTRPRRRTTTRPTRRWDRSGPPCGSPSRRPLASGSRRRGVTP